ncbi:hypothetical protein CCACVL1_25567 [Corchorus capsularis]|uniref:Uncharacterized protein n=2 Tax=Corchorus capsularis TaxID=210143 RepID=A0A1R3GJ76_COCAP|nr:hypothetical protein CCACVL1_25567 [Corchorus capsularis]
MAIDLLVKFMLLRQATTEEIRRKALAISKLRRKLKRQQSKELKMACNNQTTWRIEEFMTALVAFINGLHNWATREGWVPSIHHISPASGFESGNKNDSSSSCPWRWPPSRFHSFSYLNPIVTVTPYALMNLNLYATWEQNLKHLSCRQSTILTFNWQRQFSVSFSIPDVADYSSLVDSKNLRSFENIQSIFFALRIRHIAHNR